MSDLYVLREGQPIDLQALRSAFVIAVDSPRLAEAVRRDMRVNPVLITTLADMEAAARLAEKARYEYGTTCGVSVVIPCHNYAQYITQALDSVLAQTRVPEDIIVVDDASTDDSRRVIASYIAAHPRAPIQLIVNETNLDLAATQNRGIAAASQEHIVCLDADDRIEPRYIETLHEAMLKDRSLGVAYSGVQVYVQDDGTLYPAHNFGPFDWEWMATPADPPRTMIPKPAMFRRALWLRAGGFQQTYRAGEDVDFWLRGLATGWNAQRITDEALFTYRVHSNQQMSRARRFSRIDHYKPWMRDKRFPFAAPATISAEIPDYTHPAVSIIIPLGPGHEAWVVSALESVIGQTVRSWEVILVNDTGQVPPVGFLLSYPFVRVVDGAHLGVAHARNVGIANARATLVCFLDADDWLEPTALQTMLAEYAHGQAGYVYGDWMASERVGEQAPFQGADYVHDLRHARGFYGGITALMATEHARALRGFDDPSNGFEDWDFFIRAAIAGYCGRHVAVPIFAYRTHTGARRTMSNARRDEIMQIFASRYDGYWTGEKAMVPCCGGNGDAIMAAKAAIMGLLDPAPLAPEGLVQMEYIGRLGGPVTYFGRYVGANNPLDKFAHDARGNYGVLPEDVERMKRSGKFRVVESVLLPAPEPRVETVAVPTAAITQPAEDKTQVAQTIQPLADVETGAERMLQQMREEAEAATGAPRIAPAKPKRARKANKE